MMAQEDKRLTRINKTRFVVAANARFRALTEQPFREDAVRFGILFVARARCRRNLHISLRDVAALQISERHHWPLSVRIKQPAR